MHIAAYNGKDAAALALLKVGADKEAKDADGDTLLYTATVSGGNATAYTEADTLIVEPQESNVTLNVVVTVTDGNTTQSIVFLITVLQPEQTCLDNNNDGWCDQFPTMTIIGDSVLLLGLEPGGEYTDDGATCSDNEEGDISNQVEVSGQVVNMSVPNTYEIYYNCSDGDSNAAQTLIRTVVVLPDFISDENQDGFDDDAFMAGAQSGDANMDGSLDVVDIVIFINSIRDFENKIDRKIEMSTFRGNLYFDGMEAWEERNWIGKTLKINNVLFKVEKNIPRCVAINLKPKTDDNSLSFSVKVNLLSSFEKLYLI